MPPARAQNFDFTPAPIATFPSPRLNALKHGLRARTILLREEEVEDFHRLRDAWFRQWMPAGATECGLVERLAENQIRLRRCAEFEAEIFETLRDRDAPGGGLAAAFLSGPGRDPEALQLLIRYETAFDRAFHRALRTLLLLQKQRGARIPPNLLGEDRPAGDFVRGDRQTWLRPAAQAGPLPTHEEEQAEEPLAAEPESEAPGVKPELAASGLTEPPTPADDRVNPAPIPQTETAGEAEPAETDSGTNGGPRSGPLSEIQLIDMTSRIGKFPNGPEAPPEAAPPAEAPLREAV